MYKERKLLVSRKRKSFCLSVVLSHCNLGHFWADQSVENSQFIGRLFFSSQLLNRTESEEEEGHNTTKMLKTMSVSKL